MNRGIRFWNKTVKKGESGEGKSKNYKLELSICMERFIGFDCQR